MYLLHYDHFANVPPTMLVKITHSAFYVNEGVNGDKSHEKKQGWMVWPGGAYPNRSWRLCLPECLEDPYFEWVHWPQASIPFSKDELEYIANLDPFKDSDMFRMELSMTL
ncbi:hypothetical protein AAC387_Pa02g2122 [Persea americana]